MCVSVCVCKCVGVETYICSKDFIYIYIYTHTLIIGNQSVISLLKNFVGTCLFCRLLYLGYFVGYWYIVLGYCIFVSDYCIYVPVCLSLLLYVRLNVSLL